MVTLSEVFPLLPPLTVIRYFHLVQGLLLAQLTFTTSMESLT